MSIINDDEWAFNLHPSVPCDVRELYKIPKLLEKLPLYIKKTSELKEKVEELSRKVSAPSPIRNYYDIENLIYRAFFIDLENREFNFKHVGGEESELPGRQYEMRRVRWNEIITNRNPPCEICNENRTVDRCHIIPAKFGGTTDSDNILILCPTHHRLFDRFMLTKQEYSAINWDVKSKPSQHYADNSILENHKKFWERIKRKENSKIPPYEIDETSIYKYALEEIMSLFRHKNILKRSSIYKVVDENIKEISKGIISILVKENILIKDEEKYGFLILAKPNFEVSDELARKCWSLLN